MTIPDNKITDGQKTLVKRIMVLRGEKFVLAFARQYGPAESLNALTKLQAQKIIENLYFES